MGITDVLTVVSACFLITTHYTLDRRYRIAIENGKDRLMDHVLDV